MNKIIFSLYFDLLDFTKHFKGFKQKIKTERIANH